MQDVVSRLSHQPHVALFSRVLAGEEREEVVQQWIEGQSMLMESCAQHQDRGEVGTKTPHVFSHVPPHTHRGSLVRVDYTRH